MPGRIVLKSRSKYRNVRTVVDGIPFASKKEARRWGELKALEKAGKILMLKRQTRFALVVNGVKVGVYTCDFEYTESMPSLERVVEDVKGGKATQTTAYKLRRALMLAIYGIRIRET